MGSCGSDYCHGSNGNSGGAPDLSVEVPARTDSEIATILASGTGYMPAQGFDSTETANVIAYLRATFP